MGPLHTGHVEHRRRWIICTNDRLDTKPGGVKRTLRYNYGCRRSSDVNHHGIVATRAMEQLRDEGPELSASVVPHDDPSLFELRSELAGYVAVKGIRHGVGCCLAMVMVGLVRAAMSSSTAVEWMVRGCHLSGLFSSATQNTSSSP